MPTAHPTRKPLPQGSPSRRHAHPTRPTARSQPNPARPHACGQVRRALGHCQQGADCLVWLLMWASRVPHPHSTPRATPSPPHPILPRRCPLELIAPGARITPAASSPAQPHRTPNADCAPAHSQVPPEVEHAGLDVSVHGSRKGVNNAGFVEMSVDSSDMKSPGKDGNTLNPVV